jgi:uncharacterized protein (DUF1501 family)
MMKRRTFVKNTAAVTAAATLAPSILKGKKIFDIVPNEQLTSFDNDNIVIILEMFGGNDGLNTIIPAYDDEYYNLRPQLGIPENIAVRYQSTDIYMHPSLVNNVTNNGFMNLFDTGRLAIIQGVGYEPSNLSHFRSRDMWYSGIVTDDPAEKLLEGWLGRFIAQKLPEYPLVIPEHPVAIQIAGTLTMLLKTKKGDMGIALTDPDTFYELGQGLTPKEDFRTGDSAYDKEFNFVRVIAQQSELYSQAVKKAYDAGKNLIKVNYSDGLSKKFELISQLIAGGLKTKVFYVKLSNFDSHAQQANADFVSGQHAILLNQVARAISEFLDDAMKQGWADRVVGFTMSEFGRRAYDNGSRGTDHGAASMQFAFGNYVNGGYYGEKPDLTKLDEDGNQTMQFDFRRTYTDFLQTWLGASEDEIEQVFGQPFLPIGVLKERITSVNEEIEYADNRYIKVYPVPSRGNVNISFTLKTAGLAELIIYNELGMPVKRLHKGHISAGNHSYSFKLNKSGTYICSLVLNGRRYTEKLVILR